MLYRTCKTYEDKDNIIALTILRNCINDDVIELGHDPSNYSFTVYVEKGVMLVIAEQKCPVCEGSGYDKIDDNYYDENVPCYYCAGSGRAGLYEHL